MLYLERVVRQASEELRILHVAPERGVERWLRARVAGSYVSVDLENPASVRADLTCLPFPTGTFDLVLCSHVLEHIPDDRAAMREMWRVLDERGRALIQSPVNYDQGWGTYEDPAERDPARRAARFSQTDHMRVYGPDIVTRLEGEGFEVVVERWPVGEQAKATRLGLWPRLGPLRNEIFVATRSGAAGQAVV